MQELAFLEDPQELRLCRGRHLGNLVEEQHAAGRQFDLTRLVLVRAGERAALEAEELRLQQLLGKSGAVDGDERTAPARRHAVHVSCDHFLAGPGFAVDADGRFSCGNLPGTLENRAPRR